MLKQLHGLPKRPRPRRETVSGQLFTDCVEAELTVGATSQYPKHIQRENSHSDTREWVGHRVAARIVAEQSHHVPFLRLQSPSSIWTRAAAASVEARSHRALAKLRDATGDRFKAGIVLYTGRQTIPLGDRLAALPINALWT
jgi:hypothetical protein